MYGTIVAILVLAAGAPQARAAKTEVDATVKGSGEKLRPGIITIKRVNRLRYDVRLDSTATFADPPKLPNLPVGGGGTGAAKSASPPPPPVAATIDLPQAFGNALGSVEAAEADYSVFGIPNHTGCRESDGHAGWRNPSRGKRLRHDSCQR
ncbi:MAG: hypothetical protein SFV54_11535 [Bryobacteraceae bacterium]|nr:hypothetical protein [Bryobacteraceae bacterium]